MYLILHHRASVRRPGGAFARNGCSGLPRCRQSTRDGCSGLPRCHQSARNGRSGLPRCRQSTRNGRSSKLWGSQCARKGRSSWLQSRQSVRNGCSSMLQSFRVPRALETTAQASRATSALEMAARSCIRNCCPKNICSVPRNSAPLCSVVH